MLAYLRAMALQQAGEDEPRRCLIISDCKPALHQNRHYLRLVPVEVRTFLQACRSPPWLSRRSSSTRGRDTDSDGSQSEGDDPILYLRYRDPEVFGGWPVPSLPPTLGIWSIPIPAPCIPYALRFCPYLTLGKRCTSILKVEVAHRVKCGSLA